MLMYFINISLSIYHILFWDGVCKPPLSSMSKSFGILLLFCDLTTLSPLNNDSKYYVIYVCRECANKTLLFSWERMPVMTSSLGRHKLYMAIVNYNYDDWEESSSTTRG
ncbi:hypothetical protein HPP92_022946 [Vanilla planifolia]|uniref:Uncharacterized protein n=1 Tax=Vanilla planifolia TaxID=51239 RepID=A0A835PQK6_VANPL|nr:hypothetical protein HPP92_022946 [Vanilla planifolia]